MSSAVIVFAILGGLFLTCLAVIGLIVIIQGLSQL